MNHARANGILLLASILAALTTSTRPAAAYIDCCFARSIPPTLVGLNFRGPIDEILDRLERAGFQDYDPFKQRIAGLGSIEDAGPPSDVAVPPGQIGPSLLEPSIARFMMACRGSSPPMLMPMGGHPNGAGRLAAVMAVVADLDLTCQQLENVYGAGMVMGPAHEDPTLGALVREAQLGLAAVRVITPIDPRGPAARWLAAGGPRWIGFAVEVGDLNRTENWLRNAQLPYARHSGNSPVLRIDPDTLDGMLVEFVSAGHF